LCRLVGPVEICRVSRQDLGQTIDLLRHTVDLSVLRAADRDVSASDRVRRCQVGRRDSSSLSAISRVIIRRDRLE
jgi:hypothetical protein